MIWKGLKNFTVVFWHWNFQIPKCPMWDMQMAFFTGNENMLNASGALVSLIGVKPEGIAAVSTIVYFECEECSLQESRAVKAGGTVHKSKFSIGEYGFISLCMDTEGNTFELHSLK